MNKIAVVGESCIDEYVYGVCDRVCPEAAALCFKTSEEKTSNMGMAHNVYNNILAMNSDLDVTLITNNTTIIKRRFIDYRYNTIVFREDINDSCEPIDIKQYDFDSYDVIVFSDYCKGFLSETSIIDICKKIKKSCYVFIDTKKKIKDFIRYVSFLKINSTELKQNIVDIEDISKYCRVIVTKGENGATLYEGSVVKNYPTKKIEVRDVCGAGDTFMAGLVVKFLENKDIDESINYANLCSSMVVEKFGVTTP